MFRSLTIYLLITAMMLANCSRFVVYAGFEVNRNYIAQNLCINKNRPWLHCNGKCYLMTKLKQAEEKEKKQDREDQKNRYQESLCAEMPLISFQRSVVLIAYRILLVPPLLKRALTIFHPPPTVVYENS